MRARGLLLAWSLTWSLTWALAAGMLAAGALAGCGKKGSPVPPGPDAEVAYPRSYPSR